MIAFFQKRSPLNVLLLLLFAIVVKLRLFLDPKLPVIHPNDALLYKGLLQVLQKNGLFSPFLFSVLSLIILYTIALLLNYFFQQQKMVSRPTDLPGMSFLLVSSFFPEWNRFNPGLLASLLLVYLLFSLFKLYNRSEVSKTIFNMGCWVGVATFLFVPALFLGIWMIIAILIMRPFRLQELLLAVLGILTPFYFYGVGVFLFDKWQHLSWLDPIGFYLPKLTSGVWVGGALVLLLIPLLLGAYSIQNNLRKMLIQVRRGWTILTFLLFATLLFPFLYGDTLSTLQLVLIPLSFFHACFYYYSSFRIVPLLFFWLSFFFILVTQFSGTPG